MKLDALDLCTTKLDIQGGQDPALSYTQALRIKQQLRDLDPRAELRVDALAGRVGIIVDLSVIEELLQPRS